jgi:hypothetical protein
MSEPLRRTGGAWLVAVLVAAALWAAWGLARHPGFQPVSWLRAGAPVVALLLGAGYAQWVARWRAPVDAEREFNVGGKALFMGFAMVTATLLAWLLVSQALPATVTALAGEAAGEPGVVVRKVPESTDPDCRFRLEVRSASKANGAVQRTLDECVAEPLWRQAAEGGAVTLRLVTGALGAELVAVVAAP